MAVMESTQQETSEFDGVHFAQERHPGVVLGLTWEQLAVVAVGAVFALGGIVVQGRMLIIGIIMLLVCVAVGVLRVQGRSIPELSLIHI